MYHRPGQARSSSPSQGELRLRSQIRYRPVCTGEPPPKVCPCGDLIGSGQDLAWLSGVWVPVSLVWLTVLGEYKVADQLGE